MHFNIDYFSKIFSQSFQLLRSDIKIQIFDFYLMLRFLVSSLLREQFSFKSKRLNNYSVSSIFGNDKILVVFVYAGLHRLGSIEF